MVGQLGERMERLVKTGRMAPAKARELWSQIQADQALSFSFDAAGKRTPTQYDHILDAYEGAQAHNLTQRPRTSPQPRRPAPPDQRFSFQARPTNGHAFSLGGDPEQGEEEMFAEEQGGFEQPGDPDAFVEEQLRTCGYQSSQVEGGFRAQ